MFKNIPTVNGRINRKSYWIFLLQIIILQFFITAIKDFIFYAGGYSVSKKIILTIGIIQVTIAIIIIALMVIITVRRLHDQNKSAWWLVPYFLVPSILDGIADHVSSLEKGSINLGTTFAVMGAAISLWAIVELGFLKGTNGPNRYGPDPLTANQ